MELINLKEIEELPQQYYEELMRIIERENEGSRIRARQIQIDNSKAGKNNFKMSEKARQFKKKIDSIQDTEGNITTDENKIRGIIKNYYSNLYKCQECGENKCIKCECENTSYIQDLVKEVPSNDPRKLNAEDSLELEKAFTQSEILNYINHKLKKDKSPGLSGFTNEFFIKFSKETSYFLEKIMNNLREAKGLNPWITEGLITLLPKPEKDLLDVGHYRPITLLNTSYKIMSGVITQRLRKIINKNYPPMSKRIYPRKAHGRRQ